MKKFLLTGICVCLLCCLWTGMAAAESDDGYSEEQAREFQQFVASLKADSIIPATEGSYYYLEDYEHSFSESSNYEWNEIGEFGNFVISTEMYWIASMEEPKLRDCGCGFVFRENGSSDFMMSTLRMDGQAYWWGVAGGQRLDERIVSYGAAGTEGRHDFSLVVNGNDALLYVDGALLSHYDSLKVPQQGNLGYAVLSGAQEDYGVHCEFWDVFVYTW